MWLLLLPKRRLLLNLLLPWRRLPVAARRHVSAAGRVLLAEPRGVLVAHAVARRRGTKIFAEQQAPGRLETDLLLEPQRSCLLVSVARAPGYYG